MNSERRYNEDEIAAIFKRAARDQERAQQSVPHSGGLTLSEIEEIGKEAGITPEYIARAASAIDRTVPVSPPIKFLGFPISVAYSEDLPGSFSDENWGQLVVDLRETFQASGEIRQEGALREWRNGNLHALIEPSESGHRLRMRTRSDKWRGGLLFGSIFFLMGLFFLLLMAAKDGASRDLADLIFVSMFSVVGLGSIGVSAYRLPGWRKERRRQMEEVAARAAERASAQISPSIEASKHLDIDLSDERPEEGAPAGARRRSRS